MRSKFRIATAMLAGVAIGAIAVHGLHAQGAKLKACSIGEIETLDTSAQAAYLPAARKAIEEAHGALCAPRPDGLFR
jgi:hypothetical protein